MNHMADILSVKQDVNQLTTLHPKKKLILAGLFFFIFFISVMVGQNISKNKKNTSVTPPAGQSPLGGAQPTPMVSAKPGTELSIAPANQTLGVGQEAKITVVLSKVPVTAADVVITYDPEVVAVSAVQNGAVFERVIRNKVDNGKLIFSASVSPENATQIKEGVVMTFMVKTLAISTGTRLDFDPTATITALNGQNTIGQVMGAAITIK